jgi:hypothetical protein
MLRQQYRWPISRMDTNLAYQLAIQWLSELSIDVHALTNACRTHVTAMMVEGGRNFVPLYWVYWQRPEEEGQRNAALVELFEPTKTIRQLRVEDPQYILRKPVTVTNVDFSPPPTQPQTASLSVWPHGVLSEHNPSDYAHVGTQLRRFKKAQANDLNDPYHALAIGLLLDQMNKLAEELSLPEKLPITKNDIVGVALTPPMAAKESKSLGSLSTAKYKYSFCLDDKFSALEPNFSKTTNDYQRLTTNYLWPISRQNTNAAFDLATNFLTSASVNVQALNHDCSIEVRSFTQNSRSFVPLYWVTWRQEHEIVALVEVFEPTKTLRRLRVERPKYISGNPVDVANLIPLMERTNAVARTARP